MRPFVAALLLAGCAPGGPTLLVDVRTDLVPGREFTAARVEVAVEGEAGSRSFERAAEESDDYLGGRRVLELGVDRPAPHELVATLLAADGRRVASRRAIVDVDADIAVTLVLTRSCLGVTCPSGGDPAATECVGGVCVRPRCVDGGDDCPAAVCADDGECVPDQDCASGICDDSGVCFFAERAGACGPEGWCHPELGCQGTGPVCAPMTGDCDGEPLNGCETPLDTEVDCGRCGEACAPDGGTGACRGGDCVLLACDAGRSDCDGLVENGCETEGDCVCMEPRCTFDCSVGCDVYCPATSSCTLNCAVGAPCSMTAERDAQISVRCGGNTFSSLCGSATCTYACDDRCNCG